jgi:hypothetical protein
VSYRPPPQGKAVGWERDVHWHVFDFATLTSLLHCLAMEVLARDLVSPYHMLLVARKPADP